MMPDEHGHNTPQEIADNRRIEALLTPEQQIFEMADPCTCGLIKVPHYPSWGHATSCPVWQEHHRQHHAAVVAVVGEKQ